MNCVASALFKEPWNASGEVPRAATLAHRGLSALLNDPGSIGQFARSAFCKNSVQAPSSSTCHDDGRHGNGIWPIPPEVVARSPSTRGGRRRSSGVVQVARVTHLNAVLVVLSFLSLGECRVCPPSGRLGAERSSEQCEVVRRLRGSVASWFCGPSPVDSQFPKLDQLLSIGAMARDVPSGTSLPPPCALASTDFKGATFKKTAANFDAAKFLSPLSAACLLEPRLLETAGSRAGVEFSNGGQPPRERAPGMFQHGSSEGIILFLKQWDAHDRLSLFPAGSVPRCDWGELFEVAKDSESTRVVFNRVPRNEAEIHLPGAASTTPSGAAFCDIFLGKEEVLTFDSEDLSDFYPAFVGSAARAVSNVIGKVFKLSQFEGTAAYRRLVQDCRKTGRPLPLRVMAGNRGLVMGDLNACDWAVESHLNLLSASGGLPLSGLLRNRCPFPRGRLVQGVVIDDRFILTIGRLHDPVLEARALSAMSAGREAYASVGLAVSEKKARRRHTSGTVIGAAIDGIRGTVAAEVARRMRLAEVSLEFVSAPAVTGHVMRSLTATWNHALLYRRPLLCITSALYRDLPPVADDSRTYTLPRGSRSELMMLAILAPFMFSDLRAQPASQVYTTDASTTGLGATRCPVPPRVSAELFRLRKRKGDYGRLYHAEAAAMYAEGHLDAEDLAQETSEDFLSGMPSSTCSPARMLVETFDVLEICCGANSPFVDACLAEGLRAGPRIDLAIHDSWDIASDRVVHWIFFLLRNGRVRHFHSGVSCTTWSVARKPALRTSDQPWGLDRRELQTALGNRLLQVALLCLWIVARSPNMSGTHEHPDSAFSWRIKTWQRLQLAAPTQDICFSICSPGTSCRKTIRMFGVRSAFLLPLGRFCVEWHAHHQEWARLVQQHLLRTMPPVPLDEPPADRAPGAAQEHVFVNEIAASLFWKKVFSKKVPCRDHINIKELRAVRLLVDGIKVRHTRERIIVLLDSLVALGALAKGRSPSIPLNAELRRMLGDLIAFDLYLGFLFVPTRLNPSDDPSRFVQVRPPRQPEPAWIAACADGHYELLDERLGVPPQTRAVAEWARLVTAFAATQGFAFRGMKDFDSTLGYPGEGPPVASRDPTLLDARGHVPVVAARRHMYLRLFTGWLETHKRIGFPAFLLFDARKADTTLAAYGRYLFQHGRSRLVYAETINAVVDIERSWRRLLEAAWDVAWVWKGLADTGNNQAMPAEVVLAVMSLGIVWGWFDMAILLGLGFFGMLRPGELAGLLAGDLVFSDVAGRPALFVHIRLPKMRRIGPRREHVRIDDEPLIAAVRRFVQGRELNASLFAGSQLDFAAALRQLLTALGLPYGQGSGLTPASLRAGGATFWYHRFDSTEFVRFRGRWANTRMLEVYIQEVAATSLVARLHPSTQERVARFAACTPFLLRDFIDA